VSNKEKLKIVVAGNPNCGKSSLFNRLTGLRQKITNVPGTTIENKEGELIIEATTIRLIDTPGTYSLKAKSKDEEEATRIFFEESDPDLVVYVADAANLKRNLYYFAQLAQRNLPIILVLNMVDVAQFKGVEIDVERLEKELGVKVITLNARTGEGIEKLKAALVQENFTCHFDFKDVDDDKPESYYNEIERLLSYTVKSKSKIELITSKIDRFALHPVVGYLAFLGVLLLIFQSVFTLAEYPMNWIEGGFSWLSQWLTETLPAGWFRSLLVNGVVAGIAGVVIFVPQIAILFFFMSLMEDTGYMARVSFIMDRILRGFGLSGKSVVPLLSGAACAIPAIMSTRNIENWKDRLITIMVTPLMSCSARLPVYTVLISMAVPSKMVWGFINQQALVMLLMYVLGTVAALVAAVVFKWIIKHEVPSYFIQELPIYHSPRWKNIGITCWQKSLSFVGEAGKVIFMVSIVLWFLASYGPKQEQPFNVSKVDQIEVSYAGYFGKAIEPAIEPLGYNWKIGIALLTSFAAREVFVGTMSTIYSIEDEENFEQIRAKMQKDRKPNGEPVYSLAVVFSLMVFYAFAMQCVSTLAVVKKETKSWKWPAIQFVYMTALAYVSSFAIFQLLS
jgi:ferrous iron transport protein B